MQPRIYQAMDAAKPAQTHEFKRRDAGKAISNINVPKGMQEEEPPQNKYASVRSKVDSTNSNYNPEANKKQSVNYFAKNI